MIHNLKAPFPWFGGKSRVASLVWMRLGNVAHYIEPFFGSGAVLLNRPHTPSFETVNDADGYVVNFWRALQQEPSVVVEWADYPTFESDLHARHAWLCARKTELTAQLEGDPDFYDVKVAGWWVWGISLWIGSCWCDPGSGPWQQVDGKLIKGISRRLPHLGSPGQGVNRPRPHLGGTGRGVKRQLPYLGGTGQGVKRQSLVNLIGYFDALAERLRDTVVCCGDWSRICSPAVLFGRGDPCAVFLDPPYDLSQRNKDCYSTDVAGLSASVREWAIKWGEDPRCRIALCGYDNEHTMPNNWECVKWKTHGGYANTGDSKTRGKDNRHRERIWFSPHCLQPGLFKELRYENIVEVSCHREPV